MGEIAYELFRFIMRWCAGVSSGALFGRKVCATVRGPGPCDFPGVWPAAAKFARSGYVMKKEFYVLRVACAAESPFACMFDC